MTAPVALALIGWAAAAAPTISDIDWARTTSMPGNFTHCVRFRNLRCAEVSEHEGRFDCTYREYVNRGSWPRKQITVEKVDGYWMKVSGDMPKCAVMSIDWEH